MNCPYCGGFLEELSGIYECQECLIEFEETEDGLDEINEENDDGRPDTRTTAGSEGQADSDAEERA